MWLGPPDMKREMTRLARGGNCALPIADCELPIEAAGLRSEARAAAPMPVAVRPKKWRRVRKRLKGLGVMSKVQCQMSKSAEGGKVVLIAFGFAPVPAFAGGG